MTTANLHLETWRLLWGEFWEKRAPRCSRENCRQPNRLWRWLRKRPLGVRLQGGWYCLPTCLERALVDALPRTPPAPRVSAISHRVPLGLLLLSREQISNLQLQTALTAQRDAGHGRIGEWLQRLGFATEKQVTAALARQWACPVLRNDQISLDPSGLPKIPHLLLESFQMVPVNFVKSTSTLHIAFSDAIDYTVLYAIEQMFHYHTEPCLITPRSLHKYLAAMAGRNGRSEMVFDHIADATEFARIIRSYAVKMTACSVRLAACGPYIWARMECLRHQTIDLLLRNPGSASPSPSGP